MSSAETDSLRETLDSVTADLPKTTWKKMFGCDAIFADSTIFGLVWKTGRIGVKLPEESEFESLMNEKGSDPWKAGAMSMSQWVLVPERFHKDRKTLSRWVRKAHELALLKPKPKNTKKKTSRRRTT
jgi:TfoX/Sxy family transcriptional regulator of competence genes